MPGTLGAKIGEGAFADVHAWAPGQVVKLFKPGFSQRLCRWEAHMTRAAHAAGAPAPEVFGELALDGRFGIALARFDGPTLRDLSRSGAMTPAQTGALLAGLARSLHAIPPPAAVPGLRDWMAASLRSGAERLPARILPAILPAIDRLPPEAALCHGDLHPGNVIMTAAGPRLVDWTGTVAAPAALDLAIGHLALSELAPELVDDPDRPRAVDAAVRSAYTCLAGISPAALAATMSPCLPIAGIFALLGPAGSPGLRARLARRLETTLHPPETTCHS